ncbi:MAG: CpaF family protein [Polyangiaceae bacterium]
MIIPEAVFAETLLEFLSPVRQFLNDPTVSEIMINGPSQVYVERKGKLELTSVKFETSEDVMCALRNAAQYVGKHVDEEHPILEARLPDGSRVQAVVPPIAPDGPLVSIRRFFKDTLTMDHLVAIGSLTADAASALQALVAAKLNVLIAGGTGSGKTSLLNLLTRFVPPGDRLLVIEDSREVEVQSAHVVYLEARPPDVHGKHAVGIRELFRAALRMRPDRIVIGEIRGGEALDIVQAMVSGHGGCMGTLHATYPRDTLTRLETMAMMSEVDIPLVALRLQIASGANVIVQVSRLQDGSRKITHITEVLGFDLETSKYQLQDLFVRRYGGMNAEGALESELLPSGVLPQFLPQLHEHGVDLPRSMYQAAQRPRPLPS